MKKSFGLDLLEQREVHKCRFTIFKHPVIQLFRNHYFILDKSALEFLFLLLLLLLFLVFLSFLGPHLQHVEVPSLEV